MKEKNQQNQRRIPKQARAKLKYNAVLDACTQVLARNGYAKTTMLELSLESGVAVPTIYQYFDDKESIFVAWIDQVIDNVLSQVSHLEGTLHGVRIGEHIDVLMKGALITISSYKKSIQQLVTGVPQVLSSRAIYTMEEKTVRMIETLFAEQIAATGVESLHFKLQILVRLIIGYILQAVANDKRQINVEAESAELTILIKLYLEESGLSI
ncbi:MAG: TetR/AcrR family transcriptional regulator [Pseudomonadales bacterium]|nr:TetR/AcrR family transcriptional regulator [Pseudomonadales bacterium]